MYHTLNFTVVQFLNIFFSLLLASAIFFVIWDLYVGIQANDERSRDYTVSNPSAQVQAAGQAPGLSTPGTAWQSTMPAASSFYGSSAGATPVGQVRAWNPNMQQGAFASASTSYPTQSLMANSAPHYPVIGSSSGAPPMLYQASQQMAQYGAPRAAPPHAPAGQPMYFPK
jgi:polypyrimidine tract-binding protein 2